MIQVYPFHGTDLQEVYDRMNRFLGELAAIDVEVDAEDIRSNTKYYPDWDRTATTLEVCIDFGGPSVLVPHDLVSQVRNLHRAAIISTPVAAPTPEAEEKPVTAPADDFDPFLDSDDMP